MEMSRKTKQNRGGEAAVQLEKQKQKQNKNKTKQNKKKKKKKNKEGNKGFYKPTNERTYGLQQSLCMPNE